jgi:hypothetical protein
MQRRTGLPTILLLVLLLQLAAAQRQRHPVSRLGGDRVRWHDRWNDHSDESLVGTCQAPVT